MRTIIYGTILLIAIGLFCVSLIYLDNDPYDPIGSRLIGISVISFMIAGAVSVLDMVGSFVLWIIRTLKK